MIDREEAKKRDNPLRIPTRLVILEKRTLSERLLISYKNPWRGRWDYFIIVLAILNCFLVPLEIAVELEYTKTVGYIVSSAFFDIMFFVDIIVSFNTTIDENNEEICDRRVIAKHYLRGSFTVDFLSAFPVDLFVALFLGGLSAKQLKLFSLLKLMRMLRLSRIVRALKIQRDLKS